MWRLGRQMSAQKNTPPNIFIGTSTNCRPPENDAVTLDIYVCNRSADHSAMARWLMEQLLALFEPTEVQRQDWQRGIFDRALF